MIEVLLLCFLSGLVAGSRSMLAPAAISWAARLGLLKLAGTPFAFLGFVYTPYIFTALALGELVGDKLPMTPSRKAPFPFIGRILIGALVGGAIGAASSLLFPGLIAGVIGAVSGTLGGAEARARLSKAFGKDLPAALVEDLVAIGLAFLIVTRL